MKKLVIWGVAALVVLAGLGVWMWTLGSVPAETQDGIILKVERPSVQIRESGNGEWREVTADTEVNASDEVRTGVSGRATIRFFDSSETRLREDSTVKIEEARREAGQTATAIKMKLMSGRVWSRVLRLFDLDSAFAVRTDTVVATVRGTAFDLGVDASGTTMWVADSAVAMAGETASPAPGQAMAVPEGFMANANPQGKQNAMHLMTDKDLTTEWFKRNVAADDVFQKELKEKITARMKGRKGVHPDSVFDGFVKFAERVRLKFAGEKAPELYGKYLGRRLFGIKSLIDEGKSGLGLQAFMSVENDVKDVLKSKDGKKYVPAMRATTAEFMVLLSDAGPSSPLYRLQQRLEDLDQLIAGDDMAAKLYARLLAIDSRLSVASKLITANALEEAGLSLDGAHQGIENVERDLNGSASSMESNRPELLRGKLEALKAREMAIRLRLQTALVPSAPAPLDDAGAPTSTASTTSTSTNKPPSTPAPAPTTPTTPPTNEKPWDAIGLSAQPNPVLVGSSAQLRVTGTRSDGSSGDLTSKASFKLIGNLGTLNGPTYNATQAGSVTIEATIVDNGVTKKANTTLQVNDVVKLSKIEVLPQSSTTVYQGQQVALAVKATYSNELTSMVASKTTWTTSDPNIGSATNNMFTAWVNGQGSVTITGTYTEAGVTKTSSVIFNVIVDPNKPR